MTTMTGPTGGPPETVRLIEMVFPDSTNHYGTMFGGKVLDLMDRAAFVSASRVDAADRDDWTHAEALRAARRQAIVTAGEATS